jgi:tRNA threonylcarbamoyladenosine biosynthesis protein TsaE
MLEVTTRTPEETERAGQALAERLVAGDVVAISGELGAGKTCFVRGVARALGVRQTVSSPTFVLVNHYAGRLPVVHLDAYRTTSLTEVIDLGFDELIASGGVTLIEWADKLAPLLPPDAIRVHIEGLGDEPRRIRIAMPRTVSGSAR